MAIIVVEVMLKPGETGSDGREARLRTANPATRVQIPFRPP